MEMRIKKNSAQLKRSLQGVEKSFSGVNVDNQKILRRTGKICGGFF
jgi:hypothetical protein